LTNDGATFAYSHLVVASKFPMLPCATRKGEPRFSMIVDVRDVMVVVVKKKQSYED
jgi:hypothetical protein